MTISASALGDQLGDSLGDQLGDVFGESTAAQRIFGDKLAVDYDAAIVDTISGAVSACANQQGNADYDVSQGTPGLRPTSETVNGHLGMTSTSGDGDRLESAVVSGLGEIGDEWAVFAVFKLDVTGVTNRGIGMTLDDSEGTPFSGPAIFYSDPNIVGRCQGISSTPIILVPYSDTTNNAVATFFSDGSGAFLEVNGTRATKAAPGGLKFAQDMVSLLRTGASSFDGTLFRLTVAYNVTEAQAAEYTAYLEGFYQ